MRFNLIWDGARGGYFVSKPNIPSMEVVDAATCDELLAALKALRQATAGYCDAGPIGAEYPSFELDRVNSNADALIKALEVGGE